MKKIDLNNVQNLLFIDTETIGTLNNKESVMPFDISIKVFDFEQYCATDNGVAYEKCYLVRKFFNNKYVMMSTFSANKVNKYTEKVESDYRYKLMSVNEISKELDKIIKKYNIKIMVAHNGEFDRTACARLFEEFGVKNPLAKLDLLDTMEISTVITNSFDYLDFCLEYRDIKINNEKKFITNSGRVRLTAQAIYAYISNNPQYEEEHTGLEDIDIEIKIFLESLNRLGNKMVALNTAPTWRDYSIEDFSK